MHFADRLLAFGRRTRGAATIVLVVVSAAAEMMALAAATGWAPGTTQPARPAMASALIRGVECGRSTSTRPSTCPITAAGKITAAGDAAARVVVPSGATPCPSSGAGAACGNHKPVAERGTPLLPGSMPACPQDTAKPNLGVPGACVSADPTAAPVASQVRQARGANTTVALRTDKTLLGYGAAATLAAESSVNVTGTPYAIEIFDLATGDLVGACTQGSACLVAYAGKAGGHVFAAYLAKPTASVPTDFVAQSAQMQIQWLGVGLVANSPGVAAPGEPIAFTAYASVDVSGIGYVIQFRDATTGKVITYCAQGTTCSTAVIQPAGGAYAVVASLVPRANPQAAGAVTTTSGPVWGVWLTVQLNAGSITSSAGPVQLNAYANTDLSTTPWSIYILSSTGAQVGQPCHAATCSASVAYKSGDGATYFAVIGRDIQHSPGASKSHVEVLARSAATRPTRVMWGVDSCEASTGDPNGTTGLYPQVVSAFGGAPDFWGRYLTSTYNCPGLSGAEIASAKAHHMGILPIYDDYDCSSYSGYGTGVGYAQGAVAAARGLGIPAGTGIVVDIEPPGAACPGASFVDPSFLEGWYDGITQAHYVPVYYGDTTAGSAFANGWCGAVAAHPEYATSSYLWSFEPSLIGSWRKATAPGFGPNSIGCAGDHSAWQYALSAGSTPNVDTDEALSRLPVWLP